jgi:hypothetical protein
MKRRNFLSAISAAVCAPTAVLAMPLAPVSLLKAKDVLNIDSNGSVGPGVVTPSQKLQVRDNGQVFTIPVIHRDNCYDHSSITFGNL